MLLFAKCGVGLVVEHDLAKVETGVRFSYAALNWSETTMCGRRTCMPKHACVRIERKIGTQESLHKNRAHGFYEEITCRFSFRSKL